LPDGVRRRPLGATKLTMMGLKWSRRHADRLLARELMRAERREIRELIAALTSAQ
jgi:hypothetical protein